MKDTKNNPPTLEDIENLIWQFKPKPTRRFYQMMENPPWTRPARQSVWGWLLHKRITVPLALGFILVLIINLAMPSLEAFANRLAQFFSTSSKEVVTVQLPADELLDSENQFPLSVEKAEELAGFEVRTPKTLPENYFFSGAKYNPDRQSVTIRFESVDGSTLQILQRPIGVEYQSISVDAVVENVQIGNLIGEYVKGGWIAPSPDELSSNTTVTVQALWKPDANVHFIRWQENDILFEIIYHGFDSTSSETLSKNDLISIAEGLQ